MKYHYVYYSYEEWGRGYIGVRSCECDPELDTSYLGSFYDKTFSPTNKVILQVFCSREEAIAAEVELHRFYQVDKNLHFANKVRQTTSKFCGSFKRSELTRRKMSEAKQGKKHPLFGKPLSNDHRNKIAEANKGTKNHKARPFILIHPDGTEEVFQCMKIACDKYGLFACNIRRVIRGQSSHTKGFLAKDVG